MVLGSTEPLTEMSTRNLSECKGQRASWSIRPITSPPHVSRLSRKYLTKLWVSKTGYRDNYSEREPATGHHTLNFTN
jgi:hypothetical protein